MPTLSSPSQSSRTSVAEKIAQLAELRAQIAEMEESVEETRHQELGELPERYGFDSLNAFLKAVRVAASSPNVRTKKRKKGGSGGGKSSPAPKPRRTRVAITDEIRANVKALVNDGKTGAEIAKATGISLASVQNVKRALGLVGK